jgi:hypothetical protein
MKLLNQIEILAVNGGELTVNNIFAVAGIVTGLAVTFHLPNMGAAFLFTGYAVGGVAVLISAGAALGIVEQPWNPATYYVASMTVTTLATSAIIHPG